MKRADSGNVLGEHEVLGGRSSHRDSSLRQQNYSGHPLVDDYIKNKRNSHGRSFENKQQASQRREVETRGKARTQEHIK